MRLGAALGTALKRGARVVASRESPAACRMIKRAMISGLNSTGVDVADLRVLPGRGQPPPAEDARATTPASTSASAQRPGGRRDPLLRAARDPADARAAEGDREALHAPRAAARGLRRASARSRYPARVRESYAQDLLAGLDVEAIRARGFRIVVDYGYSAASFVLPLAARPARRRGGLARTASPRTAASRRRRLRETIGQAKRLVRGVGADLGVVFDRAGERLYLSTSRRARSRSSRRSCSTCA